MSGRRSIWITRWICFERMALQRREKVKNTGVPGKFETGKFFSETLR